MKLKSIVQSRSSKDVVVISTDPPMTDAIYARLVPLLQSIRLSAPDYADGHLAFSAFSMAVLQDSKHLDGFNACLSRANDDPVARDASNMIFFKELSAKTGLGLE